MSDERDVSRRYRELPREEPPRALDEAILVASRRAVRPSRSRWVPSLALAALLVLAVGVTLHLHTSEPDAEMAPPRMEVQQAPAPQAAPSTPPQLAKRAQPEAPPPAAERRDAAGAISGMRAPAEAARAYAKPSPESELERIAKLRADGKDEEADKALAEFRKRYPDYRIAPGMLRKVEKN